MQEAITRWHHADLDALEREMGEFIDSPPPAPRDLGALSAEAVLMQYEAAAQSFEELGTEIKDRIARLQAALAECDSDLRLIAEGAKAIREKGRLAHAQIAEACLVSSQIRQTCDAFSKTLAAPEAPDQRPI
jgi:hypothetical protein